MSSSTTSSRQALRQALLQAREAWATTPQAALDQAALHGHLLEVLMQLEPDCLGLYWPIRGEFNPRPAALEVQAALNCRLALPWATRKDSPEGVSMGYRLWKGEEFSTVDGCGIPCPDTARVEPDVVLVPCVGFTRDGFRLGYGGGYFDRWLAGNPHVTAVGVGWREGELGVDALVAEPHDYQIAVLVTPAGICE